MCEQVYYYPRKCYKTYLLGKLPYIVLSRQSEDMMKNLLKDDAPILFEGLHGCYYLTDERLKNRFKLVRTHNIEHDYYTALAQVERHMFKKMYFEAEARKLKRFEQVLHHADRILAISPNDCNYLSQQYSNVSHVTAFHSNEVVEIIDEAAPYALYHGNLTVGENNEACLYLIREIFDDTELPLVIAGSNPSLELRQEVQKRGNVTLKANVSFDEIQAMIKKAQVNILPTFQPTGIKLKLLAALYNGKHCLVNLHMVNNTGLEDLCVVADEVNEVKQALTRLMETPFTVNDKQQREKVLMEHFSNDKNAKHLLQLIPLPLV